MIPTDNAGARYRQALVRLQVAIEARCKMEQNIVRAQAEAQAEEGRAIEEVHGSVIEMLKTNPNASRMVP